ncbi:hypothetical protein [Sphingopyxis sp.]|uniref:hypothetical protein n=1 Tax=Sphingopyxis sp. TaxID=1908224 RepID=UPI0026298F24|nr:hypothetical protein [Sphingopyxis sp.]MCW0198806.1 hypothetical protein [Sphingopyxis sp.]
MTAENDPALPAADPLVEVGEEAAVDVHKPKPVHSWRELLSEVGVIVIGVAIALAGEQAVEALHWHHVVEAQREALNESVVENLVSVKMRAIQQPCVDARLAQLATVFQRHANGEPLQIKGRVGRPQNASTGDAVWQLAVQSGALNHMPLAERTDYAGAFSNYANLMALRDDADQSWIDLAALDNAESLSEGDWVMLRRSYGQVVAKEARIKDVNHYVLTTTTIGLTIPKVTREEVLRTPYAKDFCQPLI